MSLLFAMLPFTSYAQFNDEWIQDMKADFAGTHKYLDGHCYAPTTNLVYAQEYGLHNAELTEDSLRSVLHGDLTYTLPASHKFVIFTIFSNVPNPKAEYDKESPELKLWFKSRIRTPYESIIDQDYTDGVKMTILELQYAQKLSVNDVFKSKEIYQGGEYQFIAENNAGTSHESHVTVLSDPVCTFRISNDNDSTYTMHGTSSCIIQIGSGYPFADRMKQYQNDEMVFTVRDAQDKVVLTEIIKLDAKSYRDKIEFWKSEEKKMTLSSPKYTYRLSGPLLKQDLVVEREVAPFYTNLKQAINDAEALVDSIRNTSDLANLADHAKSLVNAIEAAKPCLKYSAYDQDKIDEATDRLAQLIKDTKEAIDKVSSIDAVTVNDTSTTVKRIIDGKLRITTNGHTYDPQGIEVK